MWGRQRKLQKMNKTTEKGTFSCAASCRKGTRERRRRGNGLFLVFISQRVVERGNSATIQCV